MSDTASPARRPRPPLTPAAIAVRIAWWTVAIWLGGGILVGIVRGTF